MAEQQGHSRTTIITALINSGALVLAAAVGAVGARSLGAQGSESAAPANTATKSGGSSSLHVSQGEMPFRQNMAVSTDDCMRLTQTALTGMRAGISNSGDDLHIVHWGIRKAIIWCRPDAVLLFEASGEGEPGELIDNLEDAIRRQRPAAFQ